MKNSLPVWISFLKPFTLVGPGAREAKSLGMFPHLIFPASGNAPAFPQFSEVGAVLGSKGEIRARVTKDGTLVIPRKDHCRSIDEAIFLANEILGTLLLGNFHAESVDRTTIAAGFFDGETRSTLISNICAHGMMRSGRHGWETSNLLANARVEKTETVEKAFRLGSDRKNALPNFPISIFIQGYTGLIRNNVSDAIIGLWATLESVTEELCKRHIGSAKRRRATKSTPSKVDWRKLKVSERHVELSKRNIIAPALLAKLNKCRLARNNLVHEQKCPPYPVAAMLWECLVDLITITASDQSIADLKSIVAYAYSPMASICAPLDKLAHPTLDTPPPNLPPGFVPPDWDLWLKSDQ